MNSEIDVTIMNTGTNGTATPVKAEAKIVCAYEPCGKLFELSPAAIKRAKRGVDQHFCSVKCANQSRSSTRTVEKVCERESCGKTFMVSATPSDAGRRFCSIRCGKQEAWARLTPEQRAARSQKSASAWVAKNGRDREGIAQSRHLNTSRKNGPGQQGIAQVRSALLRLHADIHRRRKANREYAQMSKWNPDPVSKVEQAMILDYVESALLKLIDTLGDVTKVTQVTSISDCEIKGPNPCSKR